MAGYRPRKAIRRSPESVASLHPSPDSTERTGCWERALAFSKSVGRALYIMRYARKTSGHGPACHARLRLPFSCPTRLHAAASAATGRLRIRWGGAGRIVGRAGLLGIANGIEGTQIIDPLADLAGIVNKRRRAEPAGQLDHRAAGDLGAERRKLSSSDGHEKLGGDGAKTQPSKAACKVRPATVPLRRQASGVRRQASGVRRQASGVRRQASGVRRQASGRGQFKCL